MSFVEYSKELREAADRWSGQATTPHPEHLRKKRGIRLYQHPIVEKFFTKVPAYTPYLWFGPFIVYGLWHSLTHSSNKFTASVFFGGYVLWTLTEYLLHRFLFHYVLKEGKPKLPFFLIHGYHHEFPQDPMRLVAPFFASWTGALVFALIYFAVLPTFAFWPLFAGTLSGYVAYDSIHYYLHHAKPKTRIGKWLKLRHMQHHYRNPSLFFGISCPWWDYVFRTAKAKESPNKAAGASVQQSY